MRISRHQLEWLRVLLEAGGEWVEMNLRADTAWKFEEADWIVGSQAGGVSRYRITKRGAREVRRRLARYVARRQYSDEELRQIIRLYFDELMTQTEVAAVMGVKQNFVSWVVRGATARSAAMLAEMGYRPHVGARTVARRLRGRVIEMRSAGQTYEQIAEALGISVSMVTRTCQRFCKPGYVPVSVEEAERMYALVRAGWTVREVADEMGRAWETVNRHVRAERLRREFLARRRGVDRPEAGD